MSAKSAIEKQQRIAREKETQRSEHKQRHEEEAKFMKKTKVEKELRRAKRKGMLNIQPLDVRSSQHSSSSSKCAKGKAYNEKIQFAQTIIQNINTIGTSAIEFLRKSR